jgi:chorismate mutase / prephenate dehydratase
MGFWGAGTTDDGTTDDFMAQRSERELEELRRAIDALDHDLVRLLNERATLSRRVGALKQDSDAGVFVPEREAHVLERVRRANQGPLQDEHLRAIYREVLSSSRELQRPPRIAYLGPPATFSNQAAFELFGSASDYLPLPAFQDVFGAVQIGQANYGVVPVENSTEGPVQQNLDLLAEGEARVCAEITLPVAHCLLSRVPLADVELVYSHPQAEAQCRRWLSANLGGREVLPANSTAQAAQQAAEEHGAAAIAPSLAAEMYGLEVLADSIQDLSTNFTRFFVISMQPSPQPTGHDKSAICFSIKDRVGALRDVVQLFAEAGLNLSAIQSRPSRRRAWDYLFFLEIEGHAAEPRVAATLRAVEQQCVFLKVLGAWPVG